MTPDNPLTRNPCSIAPEAEPWLQLSDRARDAGDRGFCLVLAIAVVVALVLAAGWLWAMPSFG